MASDAAAGMNGVYDSNQYVQPAELAASTPSQIVNTQAQSAAGSQQKADPQEIGWYFVEQYYTTLSKTPERIHLFYSKKSQLVTGVEAEKVLPAVGTKAISEKIKALDFQDCKVRVLNVDSQSSFDNIVVQVIGEMSNKSQPHHKFVQTFVLATQPNGYFVLNDIFRYLNDEEDEIIDDTAEEVAPTAEAATQEEQPQPAAAEDVVDTPEAVAVVDEKLQSVDASTVEEKVNGVEAELAASEPEAVTVAETTVAEPTVLPAPEHPTEPEPTPVSEVPPKVASEQPAAPPAKKTWASLVGNKAPAIPALPVTTNSAQQKAQRPAQPAPAAKTSEPAPAPTASATPPTTSTASTTDEWQTADHGKKAKGPQTKAAEGIVHAYIKNVTEKIQVADLRRTLEAFGELKYFDVSRPRNCAFVEFADPAGYTAAVAANPHEVNGESISVEERRPRPGTYGNAQGNFARGGANTGRGRGNFQGRGGAQGNVQRDNRGGFQQRGAKSGNVTPRGRGQPQAA